jgi:hypothetical protein
MRVYYECEKGVGAKSGNRELINPSAVGKFQGRAKGL